MPSSSARYASTSSAGYSSRASSRASSPRSRGAAGSQASCRSAVSRFMILLYPVIRRGLADEAAMELTVPNVYGLLLRSRLLPLEEAKAMYARWQEEAKDAANNLARFASWMVSHKYVTEY